MNRCSPVLLDVVALTEDLPALGLRAGQVGTVVEVYGSDTFEVEFCDDEGRTYALHPIPGSQLLVLRYEPAPSGV
jgi:hypothetical protein